MSRKLKLKIYTTILRAVVVMHEEEFWVLTRKDEDLLNVKEKYYEQFTDQYVLRVDGEYAQ